MLKQPVVIYNDVHGKHSGRKSKKSTKLASVRKNFESIAGPLAPKRVKSWYWYSNTIFYWLHLARMACNMFRIRSWKTLDLLKQGRMREVILGPGSTPYLLRCRWRAPSPTSLQRHTSTPLLQAPTSSPSSKKTERASSKYLNSNRAATECEQLLIKRRKNQMEYVN